MAVLRSLVRGLIAGTPLHPLARRLSVSWDQRKAQYDLLKRHGFRVENIKKEVIKRHAPDAVQLELDAWNAAGHPIPLPSVHKQRVVLEYGRVYKVNIFIETGTYVGDMCYAVRNNFRQVYSIEVSRFIFRIAKQVLADSANVNLFQGDSSIILPRILSSVSERCVFWLDAHYSGGITSMGACETTISNELQAIATHGVKNHVILIDDARDFDGKSYPTLQFVQEFCANHFPDHSFTVEADIIRIVPAK